MIMEVGEDSHDDSVAQFSVAQTSGNLIVPIPASNWQTCSNKNIPMQLRVLQAISKPSLSHQSIFRIVNDKPKITSVSQRSAVEQIHPSHGAASPSSSHPSVSSQLHPIKTLKISDVISIPKPSSLKKEAVHPQAALKCPKMTRVKQSAMDQHPIQVKPLPVTSLNTVSCSQQQPIYFPLATSAGHSSMSHPTKRSSASEDSKEVDSKRRRVGDAGEKARKGLRHFAMLVCEKVKDKVTTTYNEVADELVDEYREKHRFQDQVYDQKNIRRRVYDALNVLMAVGIVRKDRKDINWLGFPSSADEKLRALQNQKQKLLERIHNKTGELQELILQQIVFKNLVQRNRRIEDTQERRPSDSLIHLPFIIVSTSKNTLIDCSISCDKCEYIFNFDDTFEIHDDIEVLKRMGMAYGLEAGTCSKENLETAQLLLSPSLRPYLEEMVNSSSDSVAENAEKTSTEVFMSSSFTNVKF